LDNQSTVDVFANGNMLEDIHQVDDEMVITSNGGSNIIRGREYLEIRIKLVISRYIFRK
jgi:hypothetical protein